MSASTSSPRARAESFAARLGIRIPVLLAPMAGACPPSLSIAVANAGGLGACGALPMGPDAIAAWCAEFRRESQGAFQLNLWIRGPEPVRDAERERQQREFLGQWGPEVTPDAGEPALPDFAAQCAASLAAKPRVISSIMGVYPPEFVAEMKSRGILWFAAVTTVAEARLAESAGADAIVAQGMEAGGHRGAFYPVRAGDEMAGLVALVPQVVDAVSVPVIAAGGIADGRALAAALALGASAVEIGTGFLRAPEARTHPVHAARLGQTEPHQTMLTCAFSGRPGRAVVTGYVRAAARPDAPQPAPYPVQRGLTCAMRDAAKKTGDADRMQMWAGQAAKLARTEPAGTIAVELWRDARLLLA